MEHFANQRFRKFAVLLAAFFLTILATEELLAQFINNSAARANVRGTSRRTARRVNRRHDYFYGGRGYYGGGYYGYRGGYYGGAAVVGAAAGAMLYSLPRGCSPYHNYYNCGGTYYQPAMQGTTVVYVVVEKDDD